MRFFCLGAVILTWPLIPFGAYVRLKNAGLSCPDWPLCYGKIIPPSGYEIWLEVGHRYVGALLGIFIIAITYYTFWKKRFFKFRNISIKILILVCFQGLIGGLTVTMTLWAPIVTLHLLLGNLLLGLLVYLARIVFNEQNSNLKNINESNIDIKKNKSIILNKLKLMIVVLFIILLSGGYNSSTYSGFYCEAFPGCHEGSLLSFGMSGKSISYFTGIDDHTLKPLPIEHQGRFLPKYKNEWITMIHRFTAIFGGTLLIIMAWFWLKKECSYNIIGNSIIFLLLLEIVLGILNSIYRVQVIISTLHTGVAATLTGILFLALAKVINEKDKNEISTF